MTMSVNSVSASNYYSQAALNTPVSVSVALAALKVNPIAKIQISDTTENINRNLDNLVKYANNLTQVTQLDPNTAMNMSGAQFNSYSKLLPKFTTNYQLNVADADAGSAATLVANTHVLTVSVKDSGANVNTRLNAMETATNRAKITKIVLTNPTVPLSMTAAQYATNSHALAKLVGNYSLAITGASVSAAIGYAQTQNIRSISILDTAQNISNNLDGLAQLGIRLKEVKGSDSNVYDVNASQIQADSLVIGKLYTGYQLNVHGADVSTTQSVFLNRKAIKVDVVDTAANISSKMGMLGLMGATLNSIHISDASTNSLQLTSSQFGQYSSVLAKILSTDAYTVNVQQATAAEAQALLLNTNVSSISVNDSAQGISVAFDQLNANQKVTSINIGGVSQVLSLNYSQLTSDAAAIGKVQSNYALNVTNTTAANAVSLANSNPKASQIEVVDSTANLLTSIDGLSGIGNRLTKVTESDNTALTLTQSHWKSLQPALSKIVGGYTVNLTEVKASDAKSLALDTRVSTVSVKDTAQAISNNLDSINSLGAQLSSLAVSDAGALSITSTQLSSDSAAIALLPNTVKFNITSAQANQVTSLAANPLVSAIVIKDSSDNIASNMDAIQAAITSLATNHRSLPISISQTGPAVPLNLTAAQVNNDADALAAIIGNYSLKLSAVGASAASILASNSHVSSMVVQDTGANVTSQIASLAALGSKVSSVVQTDPAVDLELTLPQWTSYATLLRKFQNGLHANLNGVTSSQVLGLVSDPRVDHVAVTDTAAQVSSKLDTLQSLGTKLSSITLSDLASNAVQLSMQQFNLDQTTVQKIVGAYTLSVNSSSALDAQSLVANIHVTSIGVSDSSVNVGAQLDSLSANRKLVNIRLTDSTQPIPITVSQIASDAAALSKVVGSYSLSVTNALASDVAALSANNKVASMTVSDSTANVQNKIADLLANGTKLNSVSMTDGPSSLNLTYSQWVAGQTALGKINTSFGVIVSGVSAANAAQVAADDRVSSIAISDTAAHVQNNLDALTAVHPKISTVALTDATPPAVLTITGKQYNNDAVILGKLSGTSYQLNVTAAGVDQAQSMTTDAHVAQISVADSSENIATHLSDLNANTKLVALTNTSPLVDMQITGALFSASTSTFSKMDSYQLVVRDALASIASGLDSNSHVDNFTINDTSTAIGQLVGASPSLSDKLQSLTISSDNGPIVLSQAQLNNFSGSNGVIKTLAKVQGNYALSLTGVTTNNLSLLTSGDLTLNPGELDPFKVNTNKISSISISDTSQNVSLAFDQMLNFGQEISAVTLSDNTAPIALTPTQLSNGAGILSSITGGVYHLALINAHVDDVLSLSNGSIWSNVDSVGIVDNANTISSNFTQLQGIESKIQTINTSNNASIALSSAQFASTLANKIMSSKTLVQ